MNECLDCDCYDEDFGCTMPSIDKWYACPLFADLGDAFNYWDAKKLAKVVIDYTNENLLQPNVCKIVDIEAIKAGEQND